MKVEIPHWQELRLVMPECWLVLAMCAVILVPFIRRRSVVLPTVAAIIGLGLALLAAVFTTRIGSAQLVFSDMLAIDPFSQFFKILLIVFTLLVVLQWVITTRDQTHPMDVPDFLCLLLGATTGMALMASANNLLMIFVAIESASLPSYALAGFRKRMNIGSEGALKYVVFGAAASAVMVYGMSLIYGSTGALDLATIANAASKAVTVDGQTHTVAAISPMLAVGLLAMFAGFAFKLSAVPLHFWCPDVFQGAPIEVTTFLSVASKGAAVCLLVRVVMTFGMVAPFTGLAIGLGIVGAVTATWGNLAAFHQNNIKRLLAYSSMAHAGYMIMGASVAAMIAGEGDDVRRTIAGALLFYLLVYMFMNLGAFTVAAVIARRTGSEDIRDYAGLSSRSPVLAVLLSVFVLSLFGMPGLGGFIGKIMIAAALTKAGPAGMILIAALLINTLISLYFYMRPIYYMYLRPDTQERPSFLPQGAALALLGLCAIALVITGLGGFSNLSKESGRLFHAGKAQAPVAAADRAPSTD